MAHQLNWFRGNSIAQNLNGSITAQKLHRVGLIISSLPTFGWQQLNALLHRDALQYQADGQKSCFLVDLLTLPGGVFEQRPATSCSRVCPALKKDPF